MFAVNRTVGRLIEARLSSSLRTVEDVARFEEAMRDAFDGGGGGGGGGKAIVCADWRRANVLPPAVADRLIGLLLRGNPRLERSAILLSQEHATFNLQVERVVREAKNSARRTFRDAAAMVAWLGEVLTADERDWAGRFLADEE